jgi:hypothetical protein
LKPVHNAGYTDIFILYLSFNQVNEFYTQIEKTGDHFKVTGGYFGEAFKSLADILNFT